MAVCQHGNRSQRKLPVRLMPAVGRSTQKKIHSKLIAVDLSASIGSSGRDRRYLDRDPGHDLRLPWVAFSFCQLPQNRRLAATIV